MKPAARQLVLCLLWFEHCHMLGLLWLLSTRGCVCCVRCGGRVWALIYHHLLRQGVRQETRLQATNSQQHPG